MELADLLKRVGRQQMQIDGLRHEVTVLRACLQDSQLVNQEHYMARLHRWRFSSMQRLHPWSPNDDFRQISDVQEIAFRLGRCAGPPALWRLRAAAKSVREAVDRVQTSVLALFPHSICVCGGNDGSQRLSSAERLDPATGAWEALPPMLERRSSVAAAVLSGRLMVCGGSNGVRILSSTECFDPIVGSWTRTLAMLERRERAVACVVSGKLYVCGGFDGRQRLSSAERLRGDAVDSACSSNSNAVYGHLDGEWEVVPPTLECRSQAAAAVIASRLYICGGYDGTTILDSVECFDPEVDEWLPMPPMLQRRSQAAATVLSGMLYLCGGYDGTARLNSVERFDPRRRGWESVAPIAERRSRAVASVVSGMLYVFGGFNGDQRLSSAERFDPRSGTWFPVAPMQCPREGAAAASLWWSQAPAELHAGGLCLSQRADEATGHSVTYPAPTSSFPVVHEFHLSSA